MLNCGKINTILHGGSGLRLERYVLEGNGTSLGGGIEGGRGGGGGINLIRSYKHG